MKKLIAFLLSLFLLLSISITAYADVIYIPEDPFLEDHMDECQRINRSYRALTEVTVYKSPESSDAEGTLKIGDAAGILYIYTGSDGNQWGYTENYETDVSGWVPMAYMDLIYDHISFDEDYGHTFRQEEGQLSQDFAKEVVRFWNYPGSESGYEFDMAAWSADYLPEYSQVYQDEAGRSWAYVGYYFGYRNFWICLDDPCADFAALYPQGGPNVEITESAPTLPAEEIVPKPSSGTTLVRVSVTFAVLICVCTTVVLLVKMKKRNK